MNKTLIRFPSGHLCQFERGIALVLVLWVVTLLSVIAGSFVYGARSAAMVAGNQVSIAKLRALADAGVHRGVYELAKPQADAERWTANGSKHAISLDEAEIILVMRDESAKIDINTANEALLKGLLLSVGLDEDGASHLLDAIVDWRDGDDLTRPQGAERDRYESLGLSYIPTNAPFKTVDELNRVIGVTPDLYRKLVDALTVYSRLPGINSTLAPRQVLMALPKATEADVDAYLAQREDALSAGLVPTAFPQAAGFETAEGAGVYNFRSIAKVTDGAQFVRDAVVRIGQDPKQPFSFLHWQEGRL
jgi:general secretion pathway protein K